MLFCLRLTGVDSLGPVLALFTVIVVALVCCFFANALQLAAVAELHSHGLVWRIPAFGNSPASNLLWPLGAMFETMQWILAGVGSCSLSVLRQLIAPEPPASPFLNSWLLWASSAGLIEETTKLFFTIVLCRCLFRKEPFGQEADVGTAAASAIIAGIGFGVGEAILYFSTGLIPEKFGAYIDRGVVVPLCHAAWTMANVLLAIRFTNGFETVRVFSYNEKWGCHPIIIAFSIMLFWFFIPLLLSVPGAILHGLYDAISVSSPTTVVVILQVFFVGFLLFGSRASRPPPALG